LQSTPTCHYAVFKVRRRAAIAATPTGPLPGRPLRTEQRDDPRAPTPNEPLQRVRVGLHRIEPGRRRWCSRGVPAASRPRGDAHASNGSDALRAPTRPREDAGSLRPGPTLRHRGAGGPPTRGDDSRPPRSP
jgi:hypothetical protein